VGFCEEGSEPSGYVKGGACLDKLSYFRYLKKDFCCVRGSSRSISIQFVCIVGIILIAFDYTAMNHYLLVFLTLYGSSRLAEGASPRVV
jgi:hypothetical protein